MYEFVRTTVQASDQTFEAHPESYQPRVFAQVVKPCGPDHDVYELLQNGQAIQWPSLPPKDCPFDYWSSVVMSLGDVRMVRSNIPASLPGAKCTI